MKFDLRPKIIWLFELEMVRNKKNLAFEHTSYYLSVQINKFRKEG
jgi:hypothetical protein